MGRLCATGRGVSNQEYQAIITDLLKDPALGVVNLLLS